MNCAVCCRLIVKLGRIIAVKALIQLQLYRLHLKHDPYPIVD